MYYFSKWWNNKDKSEKELVKLLLANGQLEFVGGGWAMHDEATTTYRYLFHILCIYFQSANIDQMTEGHLFLHKNFGITPQFGWQVCYIPYFLINIVG